MPLTGHLSVNTWKLVHLGEFIVSFDYWELKRERWSNAICLALNFYLGNLFVLFVLFVLHGCAQVDGAVCDRNRCPRKGPLGLQRLGRPRRTAQVCGQTQYTTVRSRQTWLITLSSRNLGEQFYHSCPFGPSAPSCGYHRVPCCASVPTSPLVVFFVFLLVFSV